MEMNAENELWDSDKKLFQSMSNHYQSENEKIFFMTLKDKMENENAPWQEVLIDAKDNEDGLTFMRLTYDEFILCRTVAKGEKEPDDVHVMSLSEILCVNLKKALYVCKDVTFFEWLRARDYNCVIYDHSNDDC